MSFTCLYLIPYSFSTQQLSMFVSILDYILLGLLLGLGLIASTVQPILNIILAKMISFISIVAHTVVCKNLQKNENRNVKIGTTITISTSFVVFLGAMSSLQKNNFEDTFATTVGADIVFSSTDSDVPLPYETLKSVLTQNISEDIQYAGESSNFTAAAIFVTSLIESFTFVTFPTKTYNGFGPASIGRSYIFFSLSFFSFSFV